MKKLLLTVSLLIVLIAGIFAQKWTKVDNNSFRSFDQQRITIPEKYESYQLNIDDFKNLLKDAPDRFNSSEEGILINWPMPGEKTQQFFVKRSDVFHPQLAARYPGIKAFSGYSLEDPTAILKISMSHKGIEGMLLSDRHETVYLDRYLPKTESQYILYKRSDYHRNHNEEQFVCTVEEPNDGYKKLNHDIRFGDCQLRNYRLALACTGEYATFHGGNIPDVLAEFNASMVRVNGIYERDFTITMTLIPETDQLIFLNAATDPYTNNDGGTMLGQNQSTIDNIIGLDNYDIGHVFSTGGGGIASLRSPCTTRKARGVTGLGNPTGDSFWVDYVAHEMGHQFGGNHTQNNPCNRVNSTAMEPGSASTIMGYAGICSPNVQNNSDDYFHAISQTEVANFVVAGNGSCAEIIPLANNAPVINSITQTGLIIPASTPFYLTADATDPDGDILTYCWEQMDNEAATMPPETNSSGGPTFRSLDPNESPTRLFPTLLPILFGLPGSTWEVLPSSTRELNFNVTVRDNNVLGGCTAHESLTISTTSMAGPFSITSQNTATTWNGGDAETVTWDVANTDAAPVNCANVDILFSSDRGENFDVVLAQNVPNNGEYEITVPFQFTTQGRIRVSCSDNIFFDINNRDINVIAPFSANISPTDVEVCPGDMASYIIDFTTFSVDPVPVSFSVTGLPPNAVASFTPEQADDDTEVILTIENLLSEDVGSYPLEVLTIGEDVQQTQNVNLIIAPDQNQPVTILSPVDGQIGISKDAVLSWQASTGISDYEIEVSKNPNFEDIIYALITNATFIEVTGLESSTVYYWRIRSLSVCAEPDWFAVQSFQTAGLSCHTDMSTETVLIPNDVESTVESTIDVTNIGVVGDISVAVVINHEYVGDLSGTIQAPNGLEVSLFDRPGIPESEFGCSQDNLDVTFMTNAENTADDFENTCNGTPPAISGAYQPEEPFALFNGSPIPGEWKLSISDEYFDDGGEIVNWSITTCQAMAIEPGNVLTNNPLDLLNETSGTITPMHLQVETADSSSTILTLRSTPQNGVLQKFDETMGIFQNLELGDMFTQEDIDLGRVQYVLNIIESNNDSFLFDTEDDQSRYTANNTFLINTTIQELSITAEVSKEISCFGGMDGSIEVSGGGGIPEYSFSINGSPFDSNSTFENLGAGEYTISVMDSNGSVADSEVIVLQEPEPVTFNIITGDFEITIEADGGVGPYLYSLDGLEYVDSNTFILEDGDTYQIHVQDANECIAMADSEVTFYQIFSITTSVTPVACKGESSGSITVASISGGLAPYTYQLDGGVPTSDNEFTGLAAGDYELVVSGSAGSTYTSFPTVTEPEEELTLSSEVVLNTITLTGSGGTAEYIYSINGTDYFSSNVFTDLADGEYTGFVVDQNNCVATQTSIIVNTFTSNPELDRLDMYPNPTLSNIVFSSSNAIQFSYQITDVTGKLIRSGNGNSNTPISVEDLQKGMYMIKVNQEKAGRIFKMIKL